ncbi:NPCBM/NEW2 domain-containing protein [Streptomyces sp. NPDC006458]|uniref:NPCBM/NEW2 domain-containing protein n=1 Tax=Streptomyces sp. NPDC006458 TaxID=3154302 RepID=UPI0033BA159D
MTAPFSFAVIADGRALRSSPTVTARPDPARPDPAGADVPLAGARRVNLPVTHTDGTKSGDHGDWVRARFHRSP